MDVTLPKNMFLKMHTIQLKANIIKTIKKMIPSDYYIKRLLINSFTRIFFFLSSFGFYFNTLSFVPLEINYRHEIAMIGSLLFSILILLPLFEKLSNYLKSLFLSEYLLEDPDLSRKAYKRFNLDSLIKAVFPDMVKISGSISGSLFILNEKQLFDVYHYKRGKQKKIIIREEFDNINNLIKFLMKQKKGISIHETFSIPEINKYFVDLRADFILPFIFREKLFGFLCLSSIPDSESLINLNFLASQSALVIHNHLLSSQIVDSLKYKLEEESAARIQKGLQFPNVPNIPDLKIEWLKKEWNILLEFFKTSDDYWNFILLYSGGNTRTAGLVHSYFLGRLYAKITKKKCETFIELKELLYNSFQKANWKEPPSYLIAKIIPNNKIEFLKEGTSFIVFSELFPNKEIITPNWISDVSYNDLPLSVYFKGNPLLRISRQ